jgi:FG-GAP-like repeat/HYR domain
MRVLLLGLAAFAAISPAAAQAASFAAPELSGVGGIRPSAVAAADLNGDGANDLAVANNLSDNVAILLGNGSGGMGAPVTRAVGSAPAAVAVGDLDGDSRPDLAVANRLSANVSVLLATGGGGFGAAVAFPAGDQPHSLAIDDLNGDGRNDIVVANRVSDDLSILLGNGDGTFASTFAVPAGDGPHSIALGDLDNDGDADAAVALFDGDRMSVLLGDGSGALGAPATYGSGNGPQSVATGDLKHDAWPDVATANFFNDSASVYLGTGGGVFGGPIGLGSGDGPRSLAIGDLNGDGFDDMAVADSNADEVSIFEGNGNGGFAPRQAFPAGDSPASIAIAQIDGAGLPDVVVAARFAEKVVVLRNTGTPPVPADTTAPVITTPGDLVVDATSSAGASVTYEATAADDRDPTPTISCSPPSGATFPNDATEVKCTATDASGNSASSAFTVTVVPLDETAPVIETPADITVDATSAAGAAVEYAVAAKDDRDADPQLSCAPASGSTFSAGYTTVQCNASDAAGNTSTASFGVRVIPLDTSGPVIKAPSAITVNATSPSGAVVTYAASATDDRDPNPVLTCRPASGSTFPIGATTGECTARDASGNVSKATFAVTVKGAAEQIADLYDKIRKIKGLAPLASSLRLQLENLANCVITKQKTKACAAIPLFVSVVKLAVSVRYITAAQGDELIADALRIKAVIGCP